MKSSKMYSMDNLAKAITYASEAHSGQYRKGTKIPYIVHPLDVASILLKNLAPESVVIAGLLHDVVEDTDTPIQKIEEIFGKEVAHLVQQVSEPEELLVDDVPKRNTWKARKSHILSKIKDLEYEAKLLSCADKLSNIRDMMNDQKLNGEAFWGKFNASKQDQSWYYHSLLDEYTKHSPNISEKPLYSQFKEAVTIFFPK